MASFIARNNKSHFLRARHKESLETSKDRLYNYLSSSKIVFPSSCFTFPSFINLPSADRKSTRLNSSHVSISYAVFCLQKKNNRTQYVHYVFPPVFHNHLLITTCSCLMI